MGDNTLYTVYLGLQARQTAVDIIANNIANSSTTGFKSDVALFRSYLTAGAKGALGDVDRSVLAEMTGTNFTEGIFQRTGRELDIALRGNGGNSFFALQTAQGPRYTRNGNFTLNSARQLVAQDGALVIGANGPITLPVGKITIDEQGQIYVDNRQVDRLRIVSFKDPQKLGKDGASRFMSDQQNLDEQPKAITVMQGNLEQSNVNGMKEVGLMLRMLREFESLEKLLQSIAHDLNGRVVREVGKL